MTRPERRVRLLHVTTTPITQWAFLRGQNAFLAARGFEVHAVSAPGPRLDEVARRDGIPVHAVPMTRSVAPLQDLASLWRLLRLFRRLRPDVVHVSTPKAALLGALAGWAARVPVRINFMRGLGMAGFTGRKRALFRALERLSAALCHETLAVSPSLLATARAEGILRPGQGVVAGMGMSNGIDAERFSPDPAASAGPPVLGYVGRLTRGKGVEDIARVWEQLREAYPEASLLLVGMWEPEDPVDPAVRARLEADPRVTITGFVHDVVPFYRRMSVLLFPSQGEGFPNAPMEAAAVGVPAIASRVTGCVDAVVDGETGFLVEHRDAPALLAAARRYLDDPALRSAHGAAARARVLRHFTHERVWEALLAQYRRILASRGIPLPAPGAGPPPEPAYPNLVRFDGAQA